jgi:hypothetical protein
VAPKTDRAKSSTREKTSKRSRAKPADGLVVPYTAYAVAKDGSRRRIPDACKLVIDVGPSEVEIDLAVPLRLVGIRIQVWGKRGIRALVLGPGDGNSVWVDSVNRFDRSKPEAQ